jgi:hypothetical protein
MYAIAARSQTVNGKKFRTFSRNVRHKNTDIDVEAGTTGFRGYVPREQSARSFLSLNCKRGDFLFKPIQDEDGWITGFDIACCSDGELMGLVDSLAFALQALTDRWE